MAMNNMMMADGGGSGGYGTKVDWIKLKEVGTDTVSYAQNDISSKIEELKNLKSQTVWEGEDKDKVMQEYDNLMNDLQKLAQMIAKYGAFTIGVADTYQNASTKIKNMMS
jgi:hypothetical protein